MTLDRRVYVTQRACIWGGGVNILSAVRGYEVRVRDDKSMSYVVRVCDSGESSSR